MQRKRLQIVCLILMATILFLVVLLKNERRQASQYLDDYELSHTVREIRSSDTRKYRNILSNQENIIFVGGVPRSGTTLMRAMLDAHPDIRCGEETMIIPMLLQMRQGWRVAFFNESDTAQEAMDQATSAFLLEMIANNGDMAKRLCNKDPLTAVHSKYLYELFPNSKYILMIRDGRAVVHSMIEREVPVGGFNRKDPKQMLSEWNRLIRRMYKQCAEMPGACLMVYYERLVQLPESEMKRILAFLREPWNENVIKHEKQIGGEIKLNPHEFSTDQVAEAVYEKALTSWFGSYPLEVILRIDELAPMLKFLSEIGKKNHNKFILGYDTSTALPNYKIFASENFYNLQPFVAVSG